jgi:hypothetical protein
MSQLAPSIVPLSPIAIGQRGQPPIAAKAASEPVVSRALVGASQA